jgi:hypothetical protein
MRITTLKNKNKKTRTIVDSMTIVVGLALMMSTFVTINDTDAAALKMKDTNCREGWMKLPIPNYINSNTFIFPKSSIFTFNF